MKSLAMVSMSLRILPCLLCLILAMGCPSSNQPSNSSDTSGNYSVVVTTGMVGDLVKHVAGEHADVTALIGEGVDPHLFRPTSNDIGQMMNADVIFYSGLKLEGPMEPNFEQAAKRGRLVSAVTSELPKDRVLYPEGFEAHPDPHTWGDVKTWAMCLDHIVAVLSEFDAEHADEYQKNADAYRDELLKVDQYAKEAIATIPKDQRYLVTAHDAFEYFSKAYGIPVQAVQGITTESEPGVQDINNLVDFLVQKKVPSIFVESTVNSANIQAVIEGAGNQGWNVKEGGTLYSDSMGPPGTYEGTYIGMIDANVTTIVRALGGTVPEKGFQGKLNAQPASP